MEPFASLDSAKPPSIFCTFHSAAKVWTTTGLHRVISRLTLSSHDVNHRKMETVMALDEENRIRKQLRRLPTHIRICFEEEDKHCATDEIQ